MTSPLFISSDDGGERAQEGRLRRHSGGRRSGAFCRAQGRRRRCRVVLPPLNFPGHGAGFVTLGLAADYVKDIPLPAWQSTGAGRPRICRPPGEFLAANGQEHRPGWRTPRTANEAIELLVKVARSSKEDAEASYDYLRRIEYFEPNSKIYALAKPAQSGRDGAARRDRRSGASHRSPHHAGPDRTHRLIGGDKGPNLRLARRLEVPDTVFYVHIQFCRPRVQDMPRVPTRDGIELYCEEAGAGTPVVFVHEYAADTGPGSRRCGTFRRSQPLLSLRSRGLSAVRHSEHPNKYLQDAFTTTMSSRWMDALKIGPKLTFVGHSMGAANRAPRRHPLPERCISVIAAGCGYGSSATEQGRRGACRLPRDRQDVRREDHGREREALTVMRGPAGRTRTRDPRGYAHFRQDAERAFAARPFADHAEICRAKPVALGDGSDLKKFKPPLLVIVGDEDDWCVDGSIYLRAPCRPRAVRLPRTGHTLPAKSRKIQCGAGGVFRRRRARALARAQAENSQTNQSGRTQWISNSKARPR